MDAQKLFGKRIKELRKQNNLTQEQLAEKLGVFQKQIGNIETGTTFTTMANLDKLAKILGVEVQDLFNYNHKKSRNDLIDEINCMINSSSDESVQIVYKIVKDILK
ncbi:helix-turn-helix transcriptional regulator [bacterium]|nr:helix-turn-helix transcriptional regulator [bacterium]